MSFVSARTSRGHAPLSAPRSLLLPLVLAAFTLGSSPAWAWTWETEKPTRIWRPESLSWAQTIAWDELGETYSTAELQSNFAPPPREGWCVENPAPIAQDCDTLNTRVRTWLRDFLLLAPSDPLPPGLAIMPAECSSICSP